MNTSIPIAETTLDTTQTDGQPTYQYDVDAVDPDFDILSFALLKGPTELDIDAATGLVTWRPPVDDVGFHDVIVQVSDGRGGMATQQYELRVAAEPPEIPPRHHQ